MRSAGGGGWYFLEFVNQHQIELADPPSEREWLTELVQERLGARAFYELASAVREHETHDVADSRQRHDQRLYGALRLICGEL